jgi:response regulator RpfG family c-di-GMP phosphodiesterase
MPEKASEKILLVDDEASVVAGLIRQFRKQFDLVPAGGGKEALELIESSGPFAVVVSDFRMPEMNGVEFLAKVCEVSPDSVRIMLTGQADYDTSVNAVNEGRIFRFLSKPCPPEIFTNTISAALEQHRLITAERELLQRTLRGSIKVLTDILALASPAAFGRAMRARERARAVARQLGMDDWWSIELAAMLSHLGCVAMPPETVEKMYQGKPLSPAEMQVVERHPKIGHDLIVNIPRLEKVAKDVAYQQKKFNGLGPPGDSLAGEQIPIGARILKIVFDFDVLESKGMQQIEAIATLRNRPGWYDPHVFGIFEQMLTAETEDEVWSVKLADLIVGMFIVDDIRSDTGVLVLARGQEVTAPLLERLNHFAQTGRLQEPIEVRVPKHLIIPQTAGGPGR